MNAVQIAINRATHEIPRMILEDCFIKRFQEYRSIPKSLEQRIKEEVILKIVLPDLNMVNGVYTYVSLANAKMEFSDRNTRIYYIPKEATGGRSIMTALSIGHSSIYPATYFGACDNSMITRSTAMLQDSISDLQVTSNSRVELIAENTVIVYDAPLYPAANTVLKCILENDENLSTLRPRSIPNFVRLIILAIKGYIYNEMILEIDKARLVGGHELGMYRQILDNYADAWDQYHTMLKEKAGKWWYMNDTENMTTHIRLMLGNRR